MQVKNNKNLYLYSGFSILSSFILTRGVFLVYLASKGLSVLEIASYQAVYSIFTTFFEIPTGYLGDKIGKKSSLIIGSTLLVLQVFFMMINNNHFLFMVLAAMEALAYTFLSGSDSALLFEIIKSDGKKNDEAYLRVNSRLLSIKSVVTGTALLIGSVIAKFSWTLLYLLTILILLVSILVLLFVHEPKIEKQVQVGKNRKFSFSSIKSLIANNITYSNKKIFITFLVGSSLIDGFFMCYYNFNQIIFDKVNIDVSIIGMFFSALYFINSIAYLLADYLNTKTSKKNLFLIILFIESGLFLSLSLVSSIVMIMLISILISFLPEILFTLADSVIQNNIYSDYRATILSIVSLVRSLMTSVVYIILGALFDVIEVKYIFIGLGVSIALCAFVSIIVLKKLGCKTL